MTPRPRPVHTLLLVVLLLLCGAATAWELRLTDDPSNQQHPAISGTRVVWEDYRNGNADIYLHDAATGETRRLTDEPVMQINPQIAGRFVVWEDYRNSLEQMNNPDIYLLDLETGNETVVNSQLAVFGGYECTPAISMDGGLPIVTWVEKANGLSEQGRVFYRVIEEPARWKQTSQDSNTQTSPWVSGKKLVWTDIDLGGVYFRYEPDPYPKTLEALPPAWGVTTLRSSDDRIVWSQWDPDRSVWNIKLCELDVTMTNGTKRWLSEGDWFQTDPAIDGDLIVWSDERPSNPQPGIADLYLHDLATNQERALVTAGGIQMQSAIDGELVVFTDGRNGNNEIYLVPARNTTPLPLVVTVPGGTARPGDLDGDGRCEDVNGNDRKDFADVVLFFNQMSWIAGNEPIAAFDYNANGRIDFADVVWLFNTL